MEITNENKHDSCFVCGHVRLHHKDNHCIISEIKDGMNCTCPEFVDPPEDSKQSCPRRMNKMWPMQYKNDLDFWNKSRWNEHYKLDSWPTFPEGFEKPRACSFCGGIHPEDAINLLKQGWKVERTTKSYKRYLNDPNGKTCIPPVKIYVMHFNMEQIDRFNRILNGEKN